MQEALRQNKKPLLKKLGIYIGLLIILPMVLGYYVLGLNHWDMSIPMIYGNGDDIWQLTLTKVLTDTGWVLSNPFLGAPEVASWHHNAAAQTSALHSVIMLGLNFFIKDPIYLQQFYYLLNFSLIALTSFTACRLLNISRLCGVCVAFLFAFTTFRINFLIYSFIPNYFIVPLALVSVIWTLQGKFDHILLAAPKKLITDRFFLLGALFILLIAISDGYYAFFILLTLGFSAGARAVLVDWKKPILLTPSTIYILLLVAASLLIQLPLYTYKKNHHSEFYPTGNTADPVLIKHPFEAEVYSTSLKQLIAPATNHRIPSIAKAGEKILSSNTAARKYSSVAAVSLGLLGSLLLAAALTALALPILRKADTSATTNNQLSLIDTLLPLILFSLLCCIFGGIGTLIALIFPTIRAYDRFAVLLIFFLLLFGARIADGWRDRKEQKGRMIASVLILTITIVGLFDQIPATSNRRNQPFADQYKAERNFVSQLEQTIPKNSMVYQYPYAQYLRESPYYGWGAFSQVRLYLNSHTIHWSNGGAKNSPADDWNYRISKLTFTQQLTEIEALGFKSIVIDRTVVKGEEYSAIHQTLQARNYKVVEDDASNLAYALLDDPGYRIHYEPDYKNISTIEINSKEAANKNLYPILLNRDMLVAFIHSYPGNIPVTVDNKTHPELFLDGSVLTKGTGDSAITPLEAMKGSLSCTREEGTSSYKNLTLTLTNESNFNWSIGAGQFPIKIGYHIERTDGAVTQWDNGYRASSNRVLPPGESETLTVPLSALQLPSASKTESSQLRFALVQDGNAWFSNISCTIPL
ncbi:hypothetical protein [Pseudomonas protegens]|uniref:YfhO family protein n=1 Tax=Pseudomonas protegens (strain DSM 19095 / LMG 27888 / CFBP 6595 / CHA0) TaxID=1124983 RepID=A0A2C9EJI5_PSEPH|nr:hypothetical protein [Pseudomonas protegens]AGL83759.1 hypothetical protein PFLCHA0_c19780 [Pseudomonas protegens CHA0]MBP5108575.1 hypothetical protein [Pseudomonas protegens]QTU24767.1 hypothetical protein HUT21_10585 [Pseudomonas protegens]QTU34296.1 hypothetical protein HUT20_28490 [Pseudomonas protegens]RLO20664.1 hypothetical protein EAG75_27400 [Pseudomonas protegens]